MPIGPIGQTPIDRTSGASDAQPANTTKKEAFQPAAVAPHQESPSAAQIATQLVQNARRAQGSGSEPSIAAPLSDLVNAVTAQMGMPELPNEQRQNLITRLADDPVIKNLLG
jgi:hypothetical protein